MTLVYLLRMQESCQRSRGLGDILKRHENHSQCGFARLSSIAVDTGDLEVLVDIS